jgi:hypothetical protein
MFFITLIVDFLCLAFVIGFTFKKLSFYHPLTVYLFFHIYSFTERAWSVYFGSPTMYTVGYSSNYEPIRIDEIQRALIYADIALVTFTLGVLYVGSQYRSQSFINRLSPYKPINIPLLYSVSTVCIVLGLASFFFIRTGRANLEGFALGNYVASSTMWPMTGFIIWYFLTRNFWAIALPALVYLSIVSVQGGKRFMLVLPIISLITVYLLKEKRRWPTVPVMALLLSLILIFPYLKPIGIAFGQRDFDYARMQLKEAFSIDNILAEESAGFLDQFAGYLTLCDNFSKFEYGKTYAQVAFMPIPRKWWPGKPGLGDHIIERATPTRPYDKEGRIITYIGEAYANFGILGVIAIPFAFGALLAWFYERTLRLPYFSLGFLTYIFISSSFIQAYRDGFSSVILFGIAFNLPLIIVWFFHLGVPKRPVPPAGRI